MALLLSLPLVALLFGGVVFQLCASRPTIYVKNENDKLEPVLVAVSSTVIPLPVYRVAYGLGVAEEGADGSTRKKPPGEHRLITVSKKKGGGKASGSSPLKPKPKPMPKQGGGDKEDWVQQQQQQ